MEEKKLVKKDLDAFIAINKKYYETGDKSLLDEFMALEKKAVPDLGGRTCVSMVISGITLNKPYYQTPERIYYKVLEVLGFKIVEE